jgi:hypothetical protein
LAFITNARPAALSDILENLRVFSKTNDLTMARYLRQLYRDPMTGKVQMGPSACAWPRHHGCAQQHGRGTDTRARSSGPATGILFMNHLSCGNVARTIRSFARLLVHNVRGSTFAARSLVSDRRAAADTSVVSTQTHEKTDTTDELNRNY